VSCFVQKYFIYFCLRHSYYYIVENFVFALWLFSCSNLQPARLLLLFILVIGQARKKKRIGSVVHFSFKTFLSFKDVTALTFFGAVFFEAIEIFDK